MREIKH